MHPQIERFYKPTTLDEAVAILRDPAQKAMPVAGATEVGLRVRRSVRALVDLSALGLDRVWTDDDGLHIGAMVRAARVYRDPTIRAHTGAALSESALAIASEPIRNLTTLGGNIIHLTSWSDMPPALLALDATYRVQGTSERTYSSAELFGGQPRRLLEDGDLLTEVIIPPLPSSSGSAFIKYAKTAVDFALVNAAAWVHLDGAQVRAVRLTVGAIHTPPIRLTEAEDMVCSQPWSDALLTSVAESVAAEVSPRRDARASDGYLRHCAGVVVRRCLVTAMERAKGSVA